MAALDGEEEDEDGLEDDFILLVTCNDGML